MQSEHDWSIFCSRAYLRNVIGKIETLFCEQQIDIVNQKPVQNNGEITLEQK